MRALNGIAAEPTEDLIDTLRDIVASRDPDAALGILGDIFPSFTRTPAPMPEREATPVLN